MAIDDERNLWKFLKQNSLDVDNFSRVSNLANLYLNFSWKEAKKFYMYEEITNLLRNIVFIECFIRFL
jgi:hypothetical protein